MDKVEFTTVDLTGMLVDYITGEPYYSEWIPSMMMNIWPEEFILNTDQHTLAVF